MTIYMKIDGIDGHVTAKGYEKWTEIDSINFNVSRSISTKPGNVSDRESTKPTLSEVIITKIMDKTSPLIFSEACVGKAKSQALIHICQTGSQITPYMEYTLGNVLLSNYSVNAQKPDEIFGNSKTEHTLVLESISLNFDKLEMKYTPYDDKHNAQSPVPAGYDLSTAQKI